MKLEQQHYIKLDESTVIYSAEIGQYNFWYPKEPVTLIALSNFSSTILVEKLSYFYAERPTLVAFKHGSSIYWTEKSNVKEVIE